MEEICKKISIRNNWKIYIQIQIDRKADITRNKSISKKADNINILSAQFNLRSRIEDIALALTCNKALKVDITRRNLSLRF